MMNKVQIYGYSQLQFQSCLIYNDLKLIKYLNMKSESQDQQFPNNIHIIPAQLGLRPLQTSSANFANFHYGRGYHYFLDLDSFARVKDSPSYALDDENRFNNTYSRGQQDFNGTKLENLLNRKYIGLPSVQTTSCDKRIQDKNLCHHHLFKIQDEKYNNDRLICKYKYILKNLETLDQKNNLSYFSQMQKDAFVQEACQKSVPLSRRRQILQVRIKVLQERASRMISYWNWSDSIYYHFSLDQTFHDNAMAKIQKLSQRQLKDTIYKKVAFRRRFIEEVDNGQLALGVQRKVRTAVQVWLRFQEQDNSALSKSMQGRLKSMPKLVQMFRTKQELLIFPLFTFYFGQRDVQTIVDTLIKAKFQGQHQTCFHVYRAFVKKLFGRDMDCQQQKAADPMLFEQYTFQMKRKLVQIQDFYKKQTVPQRRVLHADDIVQLQIIQTSPTTQQMHLLQAGDKIQITVKELILLFFYRSILIALEQFIGYLNHDPEILELMAQQKYSVFHYGIAKIIHKPEFCILLNMSYALQILIRNLMEKSVSLLTSNLRMAFVCQQPQSDDSIDQEDQDQQPQRQQEKYSSIKDVFDNGDPRPCKKLKSD